MRVNGTLRSWDDVRGFGFIAPTHGGAELFVHISALPRDGSRPTVGEVVTYELGRGKDGRPQAVNVVRQAIGGVSTRPQAIGQRNDRHRHRHQHRQSMLPKLIGLILLLSLGAYAYHHYLGRNTGKETTDALPLSSPVDALTSTPPVAPGFRCDGRTHCSQMTSCAEASYFLQQCPGAEMDGDSDGVPCEQQWCTGPFGR